MNQEPQRGTHRRKLSTPTMADVARLVGVSHQTVSRVLNGEPSVKPATKEKILEAIEQTGYRRNFAARALASNRSFTIGIVAANPLHFGPGNTLTSIERAAHKAGYWTSVASLESGTSAEVTEAVVSLQEVGVDAIIAIAPNDTVLHASIKSAAKTPIVLVTTGLENGSHLPSVDMDNIGGAKLAVRHLLELGHTEIAHISGPMSDFHTRDRITGWRETLRQAGAPTGYLLQGDWTAASGYLAAKDLLDVHNRPSAIFTANDDMAIGAFRAFHEAGLRIPRDISLIGFDNLKSSEYFVPSLTTVAPNYSRIGEQALQGAIGILNGKKVGASRIDTQLLVRESTQKL